MNSLVGQSLGRYHVLEQLGEGGMATVYKAFDTRLERDVAIKIIRRDAFPPEQLEMVLKRFEREAKSLARLSHPNIVKVLDYGEYESSPYLVLEFLPGGTLKEHMGQALAWQEAVRLLLPVARALSYAHQQGIVHRDVKPANVLMTLSDEPMLTDFGIAKILDVGEGRTLTGSGVGIGTPDYMAPEQGMGSKIDARADIYSLGIILYELVTGRKPYIADTPMAIVLKHMTDPLPRPVNFAPDLPESVENVIIKTLAKSPDDRYANMGEVIAAFEKLLAEAATRILEIPVEKIPAPTVVESQIAIPEKQIPTPESPPPTPEPPTVTSPTIPSTAATKPVSPGWLLRIGIGVVVLALLAIAGWIILPRLQTTVTPMPPAATQPPAQPPQQPAILPTSLPPNPAWLNTAIGRFAMPCPDTQSALCVNDNKKAELERVKLTGNNGQSLQMDMPGSWSPDGNRVVITLRPGQNPEQNLYVYDFTTRKLTQLTYSGNNLFPAWSPDEKWIYFHANCEAKLIAPDGSNITKIGTDERPKFCSTLASWSPDGQLLARLLQSDDGTQSLKSVAINNLKTNTTTLIPWDLSIGQKMDGFDIAWTPVGDSVLVVIHNKTGGQTYQLNVACLQTTCSEKDWQPVNFVFPPTWLPQFYPRWNNEPAPVIPVPGAVPTKHIKIALQAPLSGGLSSVGIDMQRAAELALEQLSGPLKELGFLVEFVPFDDQLDVQIGENNAKIIVADEAFLCGVGHFTSAVTIPVSETYHAAGIPFISPTSTNPKVTDRGYLEINRVIGRYEIQGVADARYAQMQGFKNVFIVIPGDNYGKNLVAAFKEEAQRFGLQILNTLVVYDPKSISAAAAEIAAVKPDFVFAPGMHDLGGLLFKEIREAGYLGLLMIDDEQDLSDSGPGLLNGAGVVYTTTEINLKATPEAAQFTRDFQGKFKVYPSTYAALTYDAMGICLKATENAARAKNGNIPTRREVAEAIRAIQDYKGLTNVFNFNKKGDPLLSKYMIIKIISADPKREEEVIQVLELAPPAP